MVAPAARMTCSAIGGRQSHHLITFSASRCAVKTGGERFRGLQPGCYVTQDALETRVVLWYSLVWRGKVGFGPPTEPNAHEFVRAKRKWCCSELR